MDESLRKWLTWLGGLGHLSTDDEGQRLRKTVMIYASTIYAALGIVWGSAYVLLGFAPQGVIPLSYAALSTLNLLYFAASKRFGLYRFVQLGMFLLLPFLFQWSMGGYVKGSILMIWAFAAPMTALLVADLSEALRWFVAFLALLVVSTVFDGVFAAAGPQVPPLMILIVFLMNVSGLSAATYAMLQYFVRESAQAKARSEQLLLNVLPRPIAERLKQNPGLIADQFDDVTVLFADVVDFTPRSVGSLPEDVVNLLNEVFSEFDSLADQYGLEKIKTIGDAYMIAGGVPVPRSDHTEAVAEMALDMLAVLDKRSLTWNDGARLQVRIGVNTGGPVIAAVIGRRKFIYDVWGDMVNTASRMESHGVGGKIQVTDAVYDRLRNKYDFEPRGVIPVKGKGEMQTYFLTGRKPLAA